MTYKEYIAQCKQVIKKHEWMIQAVGHDELMNRGPIFYTVGLTAKGLPELAAVIPVDTKTGYALMNTAAIAMIRRGRVFENFEEVPMIIMGANAIFREVALDSIEMLTTIRGVYPKKTPRVMHLLVPDDHGRYPFNHGCTLMDQLTWRFDYIPLPENQ